MEPIQMRRRRDRLAGHPDLPVVLGLTGFLLLACGCTVKAPVNPNVVALDIEKKLPIVAALLITEEAQRYVFQGYPENFTAGGLPHAFPLGEALEEGSIQAFSQVFQEVNVVRTAPDAQRFQMVIEPTIEDFHIRYDQLNYSGLRAAVLTKVTVRVTLTEGDRKIWESRVESPWQRKGPWVINLSPGKEAGESASEALAFTLRKLALEIAEDASIRQFAAGQV
jgi:hypothetical protein